MIALLKRRTALLWSTAALASVVGVAFLAAAPPEPDAKKPGPKGSSVKARIANIDASRIKLVNPPKDSKPIPYKPFTLEELFQDKKVTPDKMYTLKNGKKISAADWLVNANTIEKGLTEHGETLRSFYDKKGFPKGGLKMVVDSKGTPKQRDDQLAKIKGEHNSKVSADKAKLSSARDAAKPTKAGLADDQKVHDDFTKKRHEEVADFLKHLDRKTLKPNELEIVDKLSEKNAAPLVSSKIVAKGDLFKSGALHSLFFTNSNDYHKGWNWSFGSADVAEVDVVGNLEITSAVTLIGGVESMHARGSLEADCYVFDSSRSSPHKIVEIVADFSGSESGDVLQASAKVFGQDIFTPVNEKVQKGDVLNLSKDFPFNVEITEGDTVIFGIPVHYSVNAKGDLNLAITGKATPAGVSINPTAKLSSALVGFAGVDVKIVDVGVQGNVNLVTDTLNLNGSVGIGESGGGPFLDTYGAAHDTLTLLGGEIDLVVSVELPIVGKVDLGTLSLISLPEFKPVDGFVFGPDETKVPLQQQAKAANAAEPKKK
jgi:hypothetical protein